MIEETETQILMTQDEMGIAKDKFMKEHFGNLMKCKSDRQRDEWYEKNGLLAIFVNDLFKDEYYHYEQPE